MGLFTIVYLIYIIISASNVGFTKLTNRFFSPIYLPAMIFIILGLEEISRTKICKNNFLLKKIENKKTIHFTISILLIFWIIGSSISVISIFHDDVVNGTGVYSNNRWFNSEILEYLDDSSLEGGIYSNFPHQLYYFCGFSQARYTPLKNVQGSSKEIDGFHLFNKSIEKYENIYIIWLNIEGQDTRNWLYNINEIENMYTLITFIEFDDGIIYSLNQ
jgi:hypothetical protein